MAKLVFDELGKRFYETGVSNAVLYPQADDGTYPKGVAWNGITAANESPSGAESNDQYADNIVYLSLTGAEKFEGTIEAFSSPAEFDECDGMKELSKGLTVSQQTRKPFGFAYKSILGNDIKGNDYGYKLHIWYGCKAAPSERSHSTVNDSPEPQNPSWSISSTPVVVPGAKPSSVLTFNSTTTPADKLKKIEDILYGTDEADARLPLPSEIIELLK
nr:MAG TPA: tail tube protein [Caudoviricetes sp.]